MTCLKSIKLNQCFPQCSGSMTFWCGSGSGSAYPFLWLMDPDPAIFVIDLQDPSKKLICNTILSACYFLKVHLHYFLKIKSQKESQNSRIQDFSYYLCMMIEGSGSRAGSGSIPLTSGSVSGSGRTKNTWIRWIRIRNTGFPYVRSDGLLVSPLKYYSNFEYNTEIARNNLSFGRFFLCMHLSEDEDKITHRFTFIAIGRALWVFMHKFVALKPSTGS